MDTTTETLLSQVRLKRAQVEGFLSTALPRRHRLLNLVIIGGTLSAALTGAPAIGGTSLAGWLTDAFDLSSPSWQIFCAAASVCSITVTIATQMLKSNHVEQSVTIAQRGRAKLEVLEVGLISGYLDLPQATNEYMKCIEDIAFIE